MSGSDSSPDGHEPVTKPAGGLPNVPPDAMEEPPHEIDNIVPTRGYQMIPMVALGGSAGSIVALQRFFEHMPTDSGFVFVVILHLSPEHESTLPELLARSTSMSVMAARHGVKVEPNCVYVIPPGKQLTTVDGHLRLDDLATKSGRRVAVDLFFRSLADTHGPHAAAVVLSGADGDGSIGIKRIKERGGLTVAQDPDEAQHSGMPRSAVATGMVDWVLRAAEMPRRIQRYFLQERKVALPPEEGPPPVDSPIARPTDQNEASLREILSFLRVRTGRDFSYYKRATVVRRILRRLQINGIEDLPSYISFLRTHQGEAGALLQDLLISVTNFFRDRDAFAALEGFIPQLFDGKTAEDTLRVWTPACASGEETYTLAILLLEYARTLESPPTLQVFGCDLDDAAIQLARAGAFPESIAADVSEERLRRFFNKEHGGYRIRREVREVVLFAQHDLLKDAPFSRLDLVSCRNLLIYLNRDAQQKALEIFHFALRPGALLFLGSSESIDDGSPIFEVVDKKHRIYRRRPSGRAALTVPVGPGTLQRVLEAQAKVDTAPVLPGRGFGLPQVPPFAPDRFDEVMPASELHLRLVERMAPPSIVINADREIVHLSERVGRFLQPSGGEPSRNVLRIVHPALRPELQAAIYQSSETGQVVEARQLPIGLDGDSQIVNVRVMPAGDIAPGYQLIVIENAEPRADDEAGDRPIIRVEPQPVIRQLEREIETLRGRGREIAERYEANTEELKASNEELQSMNEELRSASEELETSREELQSINEELTAVNQELKNKVEEVALANSDLRNLINATAIATIFLDRDLRITRYTPMAVEIFHLIPGDVGRPLADLARRIDYPELESDAARVIEELTPIEREVADHGRWFLARVLPYRDAESRIAGVVLTFIDVTARKRAEATTEADFADSTLLGNLASRVVTHDNRRAVLEEMLSAAVEITDADGGSVQVYDAATKELVLTTTQGFDLDAERIRRVRADGQTAAGLSLRARVRSFSDFESEDGEWAARHFEAGYRAAQSTPLVSRNGLPIGMLNTHWRTAGHRPSARQLRFLDLLARQAADLIEQQLAYEAVQMEEQRLRAIMENLPGGAVFIVDRTLRYQFAGGEAFIEAGFTGEQFIGRTIAEAGGAELAASLEPHYRGALDGRSFVITHHLRGREFQTRGVALRDSAGQVAGVLAVSFDITERRRVEQALATSQAHLEDHVRSRTAEVHALLLRLTAAQEEERRRIARDLHDELGQQMTALRMHLESLRLHVTPHTALAAHAERIQSLAEGIDRAVDALMWDLRPVDSESQGLATALHQLVTNWTMRFGIEAGFESTGPEPRFSPEIETSIYRLVQEALHNVVKHAHATHVSVSVTNRGEETVIVIEDDGRGFDSNEVRARRGFGVLNMRERAALAGGRLEVESQVGRGTTVYVTIPQGKSSR